MGTSLRSRSFREPRSCYGKLRESQGRPLEGRLHRALSLRQGLEKSRSQGLASTEGPEVPVQELLPGTLGDREQLIQTQREGSQRWLRQYQQVRLRIELPVPWGSDGGDPGQKRVKSTAALRKVKQIPRG